MKFGNGATYYKAAFVKMKFSEKDGMMSWRPSDFESNNYHQNATSYKSMGNFDAGFKTPAEKDAINGSVMPRALEEWRLGQFEQMPWLEALSRDRRSSSRDDNQLGLGREAACPEVF